jgi:hypothetical protein
MIMIMMLPAAGCRLRRMLNGPPRASHGHAARALGAAQDGGGRGRIGRPGARGNRGSLRAP